MTRTIDARYCDPLDLLWLELARKLGLVVVRSGHTYASTDGRGTLYLSAVSDMDPDDCLAQMILHEICHWMVQGRHSVGWVDWGLDNEGTRDVEREHACLRLQAALLDEMGLRRALGPTTSFRAYYDALPRDPFEEQSTEQRQSIVLARAAFARRNHAPFGDHLSQALRATATILRTVRDHVETALHTDQLALRLDDPLPRHAVGLPCYPQSAHSCQTCAWLTTNGTQAARFTCRQAGGKQTRPEAPACTHYEPIFDCLSCGACCREAYDTVEVKPRDPARKLHLALLVEHGGGFDVARKGARCACLNGGTDLVPAEPTISGGSTANDAGHASPPLIMPGPEPFTCSIYETRPKTCRDFTIFSAHCLYARRRVGLSR